MSSPKPTLAFFGATGGCASAALCQALREGYRASALARTPAKLEKLLRERNVPESAIQNLTIIKGDVADQSAVSRALRSVSSPSHLADVIVSGIGGTPKTQASLRQPISLDNPHICQEATANILTALKALSGEPVASTASGKKPLLVTVSTTGISTRARDVPLVFVPLYHWFLAVPHVDKREMERLIAEAPSVAKSSADPLLADFVVIRPSLLVDGEASEPGAVRTGWEWPTGGEREGEESTGPMIGYRVRRADVGRFIMEEVVKGTGAWNGKMVTLTN